MMQLKEQQEQKKLLVLGLLAVIIGVQTVSAVITVQIGGANRLSSLTRSRDRYSCYWDCDLVGCQIAREDDECAYDCEKICRVRYDYAGRSGAASSPANVDELKPKSAAPESTNSIEPNSNPELIGAGTSVRLHLPRNVSARNFAIWERCSSDADTGKLTEKPFNL